MSILGARRAPSAKPAWYRLVAVVAGVLLLLFGWPALPAHAADPVAGISGTVTLPGGDPAIDASVCLYWDDGDAAACTNTDGVGAYSFDDVQPGTFAVGARLDGYFHTYFAAAESVTDFDAADRVDVDGEAVTGIDFTLIEGATFTGTVRLDGQPVDGADVCAATDDDEECASTGSDGRYSLRVLPGTLAPLASWWDELADTTLSARAAATTVEDGQTYPLDFDLPHGTGFSGLVSFVDRGDDSLYVRAYEKTAAGEVRVATHHRYGPGRYLFRDLDPGTYIIRFSADGQRDQCFGGATCTPVVVKDGEIASLSDVTLVAQGQGSLTGLVIGSDDAPLAGVTVEAAHGSMEATATTDASGRYTFAALAGGYEWDLAFSKDGYSNGWSWATTQENTTTTATTVRLFGLGSISGVVRGTDGAPVQGARVIAEASDDDVETTTGADGSYRFDRVRTGRYRVRVVADDYLAAYAPGVKDAADARRVAVTEQGAAVADVQLAKPVTVSGQLTDTAGQPLSGWVALAAADDGGVAFASAGSDGQFTLSGAWPGRYTILAEADGYTDTWLGDADSEAGATWLALASGASASGAVIRLARAPGHEVSGTVRTAAGDPATNLEVYLGNEDASYSAYSDAAGAIDFGWVRPGRYDVTVYGERLLCGPDGGNPCSPATITVGENSVPALAIALPRLGSLSGTVTLPDGVHSTDGHLHLSDAAGDEGDVVYLSGAGTYRFDDLPFGTYSLRLHGDDIGELTETVVVDGDVTHDLNLSARQTISGTVTVDGDQSWLQIAAVDPATGNAVTDYWFGDDDDDGVQAGSHPYSLDVPPGTYVVGALTRHGWTWHGGTSSPVTATRVTLTDADVTGVDVTTVPPSGLFTVTGRILFPQGLTADDMADWDGAEFENLTTGEVYDVYSLDGDGSYSIRLPKGRYEVTTEEVGELNLRSFVGDLRVAGDMTYDIDIPAGGALQGRFVGADGVGIDEGKVWVTVNGRTVASDWTDEHGYWLLGALPIGAKVVLHASKSGFAAYTGREYAVVAGDPTGTGVQTMAMAGRVKVRIPALPAGDDGVKVKAVVTDLAGNALATKSAFSGEEAEYVTNVPAGKVLLRFEGSRIATEWWQDADSMVAATPVVVTAGQSTATIVPTLALGVPANSSGISGTVTNATGKSGTMFVRVIAADESDRFAPVAADGTWSANVPAGSYKVRAALCDGYWMGDSGCMGTTLVAWYKGISARTSAEVAVTAGSITPGVDVTITGGFGFTTAPRPTVTGDAVVGATLTASAGTWDPVPDSLAYQWARGGKDVAGATGQTYLLTSADADATLTVTVTATKAGLDPTPATSVPTAKIAKGTLSALVPTISGAARVGATLTAVTGEWRPAAVAYAYQWLRNGAAIDGAASPTYLVTAADAGARLSVAVTGTKDGYEPATKTSAETAAVTSLTFSTTPVPTISGTAKVGATLTAKPGTWLPTPDTLRYAWSRSGTVIENATGGTYQLAPADAGKAITVTVTAVKVGYTDAPKTSKATAKVANGSLGTATPTITGTPKVGEKLTASENTWTPAGVTFAYQWYRSGKKVKTTGTSKEYVLVAADLGKKMTVRVTGSATGYSSASKTSKSSKKVVAGTLVPGTAGITGTPQVGLPLAAVAEGWGPAPVSFGYQWYRAGKAISKATKSTYTPVAADLATAITVKVTGRKSGYTSASVTSTATAPVAVGVLTTSVPTISGTPAVGKKLTAKPGAWGPGTVSLSYRWTRNGTAIAKATRSTYTLVAADAGATITVEVTGRKDGFTTATKASDPLPVPA